MFRIDAKLVSSSADSIGRSRTLTSLVPESIRWDGASDFRLGGTWMPRLWFDTFQGLFECGSRAATLECLDLLPSLGPYSALELYRILIAKARHGRVDHGWHVKGVGVQAASV